MAKIIPTSSNLRGHVLGNHPTTGLPASINADPHGTLSDPKIPRITAKQRPRQTTPPVRRRTPRAANDARV